jgi:hypothetical protein
MKSLLRRFVQSAGFGLAIAIPVLAAAEGPATRPATGPATAPATQPAAAAPKPKPKLDEQFLLGQRNQRDNARNSYGGAPSGAEVTLDQLMQWSLDRGALQVDVLTVPGVRTTQRYKVKGSDAIWQTTSSPYTVQQMVGNAWVRQTVTSENLDRIDVNAKTDPEIWSTHVSANPNSLSIRGQSVSGYIYFSQSRARMNAFGVAANVQPTVSLMVQEWAGGANGQGIRMNVVFHGTARSIPELRAKYPAEFRKHFVALMSKLSDLSWMSPGAADAYAVFSEIPADPQVTAMVDALLPDLDSDVFAVRDAAGKQLLGLGAPAVLAVLRKDLSGLSDEQRAQVGRLIASHRRRGDLGGAADARSDASFLADCLEHSDPAVRAAAKSSLEKLLGEPLKFDPKLPVEKLGVAADEVRKKISEKQAAATTQPAEANNVAPAPAVGNVQIQLQGQILVK